MKKRLFYYIEELQELRTEKSYELFNKPLKDLSDDEIKLLNEYINDIFNPEWKENTFKGIPYLVSNIGQMQNEKGKILKTYGHSQKNIQLFG